MVALGIDFGTTNSAAAIAYDDERTELVAVDQSGLPELLPSLVYLDRDHLRLQGSDAARNFMVRGAAGTRCSRCDRVTVSSGVAYTECRQYAQGGRCSDARLISGLKYEMADAAFTGTNSWGEEYPLVELVADVLRRLSTAAKRRAAVDDFDAVSIGFPFVFHGAEGPDFGARQALARHRLLEAARLAGLRNVELVYEAQAAASAEDAETGLVLTTDFGGGTFDVAIIDFRGDPEVVGLGGVAIGGDLVDQGIVRSYVMPHLGLDRTYLSQSGARLGVPNQLKSRLLSLSGLKHLMQDRSVGVLLRELEGVGVELPAVQELLYGGQAWSFYNQVEQAKRTLAAGETAATIDLNRLGIPERLELTSDDLDAVVEPLLAPVEESIRTTLHYAALTPRDITYAVRTGGSSQLPQFVSLLGRIFANRVRERDPFSTVVTGLALDALGR
jgi:hypothetical chaperone protein